jgi:hypothetical protein
MKRPAFLDQPGMHIVTQRTGQPMHDYANPVQRFDQLGTPTERVLGVILAIVIGLLCAMGLVNILSR